MSTGNLQEMGAAPMAAATKATKQSKSAVNANARPGDPMLSNAAYVAATPNQSITDLGGPTPDNYRSTDDSSKYSTQAIATVRDVVNAKAMRAEEEELEYDEEILEAKGEEGECESEDEALKKKHRKKMKEEVEEDEDEEEYEDAEEEELQFNVEEDVQALFGEEDLSEEFKERAKTVFEAALRTKVQEAADMIAARYEAALEENVLMIHQELTERVDTYLEYVAGEWLTENALQVERGLKSELSESFMTGLKSLFEDHYVEIPEEKYNVLESMVDKLDEMESKLNEQIERNVLLTHRLSESVSDSIFHEVSRGLAETQKEKLAGLAESVEFISEEDYREKLEVLRESYFSRTPVIQTRVNEDEMLGTTSETISESMDAYLRAIQKYSK
jgi:hypothetical protein